MTLQKIIEGHELAARIGIAEVITKHTELWEEEVEQWSEGVKPKPKGAELRPMNQQEQNQFLLNLGSVSPMNQAQMAMQQQMGMQQSQSPWFTGAPSAGVCALCGRR